MSDETYGGFILATRMWESDSPKNQPKKGDINDFVSDIKSKRMAPAVEEMFTYKIWDIKKQEYVDNAGGYSTARAPYDCFPEQSVKRIAGRLLGKGNYEVHKFSLIREE